MSSGESELLMRFGTRNEIEYLSSIDGNAKTDAGTIDEMTRQLDALRRFDQNVFKADWQPKHAHGARMPNGLHATR